MVSTLSFKVFKFVLCGHYALDEEEERERWLLLIEDAVNKALDSKPHFDMELEMLRNREVRRKSSAVTRK